MPDDLSDDERWAADAAARAARATFAGFADRPGSEYYAAPGLTPAETWTRIAAELGRVAVLAAVAGLRDRVLSVTQLADFHRAIFEPAFGPIERPFRGKAGGVEYPIVLGTLDRPALRTARGVRHRQIESRLAAALDDFEGDVAVLRAGPATLRDGVRAAVRLYVRVIRIHPYADGNGRTAWVVFAYAMTRLDLLLVALPPTPQTRWALGAALRSDAKHDYEPLVDLVVRAIGTEP